MDGWVIELKDKTGVTGLEKIRGHEAPIKKCCIYPTGVCEYTEVYTEWSKQYLSDSLVKTGRMGEQWPQSGRRGDGK